MKYREVKQLNLPEKDKEILTFWERESIFEKSVEQRDVDNAYIFYEGPPSANGKPGIHHVMGRTVKDIVCRYQTLLGKRVERKGGWDTHGLPIELSVEKELGITKEDIGKRISVDEYNAKCRETVMRYKDQWDDITRKMGYWVDLDDPYITFENNYIESVWYLLKQLYNKNLLYKGYTIQPYSPKAGTGLSTHELNQPGTYRDVKDTSVAAQFKVVRDESSNALFNNHELDVYFLAWTTTPWTLPSNCALAVGARIDYVMMETYNPYTYTRQVVVLAKDLVSKYFNQKAVDIDFEDYEAGQKLIPYRQIGLFSGKDLEGIHYEQLMPYVQPHEGDAFRVIIGDFVSTEDGTGIVHTASVFGADDFRVAQANNIPPILVEREDHWVPLVDRQGRFVEEVNDYAGRYVREEYYDEESLKDPDFRPTDVLIAIKLKEENKAFKVEKYTHSYPHCWRTDKPVLYYPLDSWFVRTTAAKERMVELNKTINWKPAHTGEKRFGNWLDNLQDWNLSRSRFWGIPLPIWRSEDKKSELCIGSISELTEAVAKANDVLGLQQVVPDDLHRPYIDDVILVSDSGQPMKRELDLIDVWFDSGSMPYAQWHYPFENVDKFKHTFPADFIAEGVDQTRGWFFTLHAIASLVFDSVAFKNVISNGLVLDKNGVKMSKRLGNAIDPFEAIATHGADAVRWYMISNSPPWDNLRFDMTGVLEVRNKFFGTLFNTYKFYAQYANLDNHIAGIHEVDAPAERSTIDHWILSKLHSTIVAYRAAMDDFELTKACRLVESFVIDHLSNWYVRLNRRRFWKSEMSDDKHSAYNTLAECLTTTAQLISPVAPFFADWLYKAMTDPTGNGQPSVHMTDLIVANKELINPDLERKMYLAQKISSLVLSIRKKESIRVRQPLKRILLPVLDDHFKDQVEAIKKLVLSEVNVKSVEYIHDTSGLLNKSIKPNFKTLGKRLGRHMKSANQIISGFDQETIRNIEQSGVYELHLDGEATILQLEDFLISSEDIPGWQVASEGGVTVALDTSIDESLKAEGVARELVNRIQNIRKENDFQVTDRIRIELEGNAYIIPAVEQFGDYIQNEVLASEIVINDTLDHGHAVVIDEVDIHIVIQKAE